MSPSSSNSSSAAGNAASKLRRIMATKPTVNIVLEDPKTTYSTGDQIAGNVEITTFVNTRFDDVEIQFVGVTKTLFERMAVTPGMAGQTSSLHIFLRLTQPMLESAYPTPRVLEAGHQYKFPFLFVVPRQLLPRVCKHEVQHDTVRDAHLQLPPSLGSHSDTEGCEPGLDDFAPEMANIRYQISVRVTAEKGLGCQKKTLIARAIGVRVVPASEEQPPVNVEGRESDYVMRTEKNIKKGLFKGRTGTLVIEAAQPRSLRLPTTYLEDTDHSQVSTSAKIRLRFDPAEARSYIDKPPRLGNLNSKLKISTWYADSARKIIPNQLAVLNDMHQGVHRETISLSSRPMDNVEWTFHKDADSTPLCRRDSGISTYSSSTSAWPEPSRTYCGQGFYTADIIVPVSLPQKKNFLPTFHSCLCSRTYTLNMNLGISSSSIGTGTANLQIPVQISAEGSSASIAALHRDSLTYAEQAEESLSAEEFFTSRTLGVVDESLLGNANIGGESPPQYNALVTHHRFVRVSA